MERWAEEYATQAAHIKPDVRAKLLAMSDRTMSRLLSGEVRVKPGWARGNKRSGRGARNEVKANTPCASGEVVMACNVPPGDAQIDTFALGGGDPSDNFFWILDGTDRKTQWDRLSNIRAANPEICNAVEMQLIQLAQSGRLQGVVNDDMLRQFLRQISPQHREITIERR